MGRILIDLTTDEHKKLKAVAAFRGKSIKDYVLERALGAQTADEAALRELESLISNEKSKARLFLPSSTKTWIS